MAQSVSKVHPSIKISKRPIRLTPLERLMTRWFEQLQRGQLTIDFPSGHRQTFRRVDVTPQAALNINDPRLVLRMLFSGDLGLAESYLKGEWETPDLSALLTVGSINLDELSDALQSGFLSRLQGRLRHTMRANTKRGSRRNIAAHYDLGNSFYRQWLDSTMTYSSALFTDFNEPLSIAQDRKYAHLAAALDIQPGEQVLEIGCGWGGFAEYAATTLGCEIVALPMGKKHAPAVRRTIAATPQHCSSSWILRRGEPIMYSRKGFSQY